MTAEIVYVLACLCGLSAMIVVIIGLVLIRELRALRREVIWLRHWPNAVFGSERYRKSDLQEWRDRMRRWRDGPDTTQRDKL